MLANLCKDYIINTIIGGFFVIFLVVVTGRPMTQEDYTVFIFLGWIFGWFLRGAGKAQVTTTKDAVGEIKKLRNKG